jgi:hypothetical protein
MCFFFSRSHILALSKNITLTKKLLTVLSQQRWMERTVEILKKPKKVEKNLDIFRILKDLRVNLRLRALKGIKKKTNRKRTMRTKRMVQKVSECFSFMTSNQIFTIEQS